MQVATDAQMGAVIAFKLLFRLLTFLVVQTYVHEKITKKNM